MCWLPSWQIIIYHYWLFLWTCSFLKPNYLLVFVCNWHDTRRGKPRQSAYGWLYRIWYYGEDEDADHDRILIQHQDLHWPPVNGSEDVPTHLDLGTKTMHHACVNKPRIIIPSLRSNLEIINGIHIFSAACIWCGDLRVKRERECNPPLLTCNIENARFKQVIQVEAVLTWF